MSVVDDADFKLWVREMLLRFDKVHTAMMRGFDEMHDQHLEHSRRLDDVIAENVAQRKALFKILDRLDGAGGSAPA
jgi:hypothetical protein